MSVEPKSYQFICPNCGAVTDKGGSGQRKRCTKCAAEQHKTQMRQWQLDNFGIGRGA